MNNVKSQVEANNNSVTMIMEYEKKTNKQNPTSIKKCVLLIQPFLPPIKILNGLMFKLREERDLYNAIDIKILSIFNWP